MARRQAGPSSSTPRPCRACSSTRSTFAEVVRDAKNQAEKDFLVECLQNANWLTRSLDQRAKTILKVATEIVRQQDAFLAHGVQASAAAQPAHRGGRDRHA